MKSNDANFSHFFILSSNYIWYVLKFVLQNCQLKHNIFLVQRKKLFENIPIQHVSHLLF